MKRAIWMLEKAASGIDTQATVSTMPKLGFPTRRAMLSAKMAMHNHRNMENIKLLQKATVVLCSLSVSSLNSCCTRYFWNPASVNSSTKDITIVNVATTPNASGVSSRANTMFDIGTTSLATISVIADHFVACNACCLRFCDIYREMIQHISLCQFLSLILYERIDLREKCLDS